MLSMGLHFASESTPAAFLIKGNGANAQEVAQLKGDMDAIEQANVQKKCGIQFSKTAPVAS
jgi:hypothetical protein